MEVKDSIYAFSCAEVDDSIQPLEAFWLQCSGVHIIFTMSATFVFHHCATREMCDTFEMTIVKGNPDAI